MLDTDTRQVDASKGIITSAHRSTVALGEERLVNACAAAHRRHLRMVIARLVVFQIERCIEEGKVREQPLSADPHGELEQVIVRVLRVVVDAFLHLKNANREDWRLAVAETSLLR